MHPVLVSIGTRSRTVDPGFFLPPLAAIFYYVALAPSRALLLLFTPQLLAYIAMAAGWREGDAEAIGLRADQWGSSLLKGSILGLVLGGMNLWILVKGAPLLGKDPGFLRETPHARLPFWLMFPVGLFLVALFVEVNFRGWFLSRLLHFAQRRGLAAWSGAGAVLGSALVFSFDPFMVAYFGIFHWLALSDGILWGFLRLRTRSIWAPVAAHTVEVWLIYLVLKLFYA